MAVTSDAAQLQARLTHIQGHVRLPSVVAGVSTAGTPSWTGGAGDVAGPPADTQYRIGSITKTLVAVLVMRARDEGLLALDDPIGKLVPETGYADATVGSLLAHVSGLQSEPVGSWWERSPGHAGRRAAERQRRQRGGWPARGSTTTTATSGSRCSARRSRGCAAPAGGTAWSASCSNRSA